MKKILLLLFFCLLVAAPIAGAADDDPLNAMKEETLRFFTPVSAKITAVEAGRIRLDAGSKDGIRAGMRLNVLREGEPFLHPVTKEVLGRAESIVGKIEVKEVQPEGSVAALIDGSAQNSDRVRLSESKVSVLFVQDRKIDWYLADDYYRRLKGSGRVTMVDTALETADPAKVIEEAKRLGSEVALLLTAREADRSTILKEELFWASDGSRFFEKEAKVDVTLAKELKFGSDIFAPHSGEALLRFSLPFGARFVTTGDYDGDGKQEIILSTGKDARAYLPAMDLLPLWEVKGTVNDEHLWLDSVDVDGDGRDDLVITSLRSDKVYSTYYRLDGKELKKFWEGEYFVRKVGNRVMAQTYSSSDGFEGPVFVLEWKDGASKQGEKVKLPKGVNLYDFLFFEDPASKEMYTVAYDEKGFLNLFDSRGIRAWRSSADMGGFLTTFKKRSPASYIEADVWSVKDRLQLHSREVIVMQRTPALDMARGVGYKNSRIKGYWWNGYGMEETSLVEDIAGTVLDYAVAGDKMVVLSSPFLGIKFDNILKGENPLVTQLGIYSIRGR